VAFHAPDDFLSQFLPIIPQAGLWWLGARAFLAKLHTVHAADGGRFRSTWLAIPIGLFGALLIKLIVIAGIAL
jgi:hypothetical protein